MIGEARPASEAAEECTVITIASYAHNTNSARHEQADHARQMVSEVHAAPGATKMEVNRVYNCLTNSQKEQGLHITEPTPHNLQCSLCHCTMAGKQHRYC